ncbi:MAG TPA: cyclic nucleotide-binding/CBS domain-containing protein, partial [Chromatiaceae bacterium]|nr:cyclic nucleotide-binding/CBS domain-containing protein [Chromatiaceae bacterium]
MEIELQEIRDFLAATPPFDRLPAETLERLPEQLQIRYLRRGSPFPPEHADQPLVWLLRSGAIELRDARQRLIGRLGEGAVHADACQNGVPAARGEAIEDSLLY